MHQRETVDLSGYPDLVVILLGMRVNTWRGLKTLLGFGPRITDAAGRRPDGLLHHESFLFSLFPPHVGIRQYWRDFDALEAWARGEPHARWWRAFVRDPAGTGFWHEAYFMRGGMEAVYINMPVRNGMRVFAPAAPARGAMFSSRRRAGLGGPETRPAPVSEASLYGDGDAA